MLKLWENSCITQIPLKDKFSRLYDVSHGKEKTTVNLGNWQEQN